jgi:hypothetical protein
MTDCSDHTEGPSPYLARAEWFEKMAVHHEQRQCDECGLWKVWALKPHGQD